MKKAIAIVSVLGALLVTGCQGCKSVSDPVVSPDTISDREATNGTPQLTPMIPWWKF